MKKVSIGIVMLLVFVLSFASTQTMNENLTVSKKLLNITDKITIDLPIIKDSNNNELKELNKFIEKTILEYFDYAISQDDGTLNLNIEFDTDFVKNFIGKVYINENILSIPLVLGIYYDRAAYPMTEIYGINIDIKSQKIIELKDLINTEGLSELLLSDKVRHLSHFKGYYDSDPEYAEKEVSGWVEHEKTHNESFFITKDSIIVSMNFVGKAHGWYALIEIPKAKLLKDYQNKKPSDEGLNNGKQNTSLLQKAITVDKQYLYKTPLEKTKMYLIKDDIVEIIREEEDWTYILYETKTKKYIKAWIPSSSLAK